MRALKILHVLRAPVGGLFRHVVDLVQGQIARGHQVGVVADSLTGNARSREVFAALAPMLALGLTLTPIHRPFGQQDLAAAWHVTKRARKAEPDVIHGHGAKNGAFARLALAAKPAIRAYTPHGGSLLLDHQSSTGKAYLALERLLMMRISICSRAPTARASSTARSASLPAWYASCTTGLRPPSSSR